MSAAWQRPGRLLALMDAPRLELDGVSINFGGVRALDSFSLRVEAGEIRGLIGPNGSGKSTAFNVVTGLYRPGGGDIRVDGRSVVGLRTDEIASRGVARTFQTLRLFRAMTVVENVMLGTHLGARPPSAAATLLSLPAFRRFEADARERSLAALAALHIADYAQEIAGNLPYGVQKRIDLARSLVANPSLLLLDEPAAGLTEAESHQLMELIRAVHAERGFALLLVEHDMQFVTNLCPHITVIDFGKQLAEGTPREVRENREVVVAYLGTGELSAKAKAAPPAATTTAAPLLEVGDLGVRYGAVPALRNVSVSIAAGGITAIIGANGAGKTTLLSTVSGIVAAHHGRVLYGGRDVTRLSCEERVAQGIVMCPEGRRLFPDMTVQENLLLGAYNLTDAAAVAAGLERTYALFPRIAGRRKQLAGTLSGGEQQMVAIGRALMAAPKLLLLDEPSLGLAPNLVELIFETIAEIRKLGCAIMLVEQNASMALELADFGYVLETGAVTLAGPAAELRSRHDVVAAYLG
ncbi:MAG TPA: ATP-binding cassette domain-containing protein [Candidatus Acidoferrum sp.]|nr:ATP-binding cassette domain-containing protein [Candidatus Acidoferrum sp.]